MFNSLRWTLLSWYAVILAAVIGGFGASLYYSLQRAQRHEVDASLRAHLRTIAASITVNEAGTVQLAVAPDYRKQFSAEGKHASYFAVWDTSGRRVAASRDDLDAPPPDRTEPPGPRRDKNWPRDLEIYREMNLLGPADTIVTVGQRVDEDQRRLYQLLAIILATGSLAWLLALVGGWFLASRMLAPIDRMSAAASAISAGDLSQRIDLSQTENELGRLARVVNSAFDRLENAYAEQARFTADASHELRTPLAVLLASASLALRRQRTPEEYRQALKTSLQAGERMHDLVERMLLLARADTPRGGLRQEPVELLALIEEAIAFLQPLADEHQVRVSRQLDSACVLGDEDALRQVISNLLSNAVRYTPAGGSVEVTLAAQPDQAILTVADTGIGIPAEDLPHLFDRFYRVDKARSRRQGGSGLGLAIAKALVTAHGGSIACKSTEGAGASFVVSFPLMIRSGELPSNNREAADVA